jgi:phosphohistidine phosphatase SixA
MRLLVIRHAKAAAREDWHKDDHLRPLTKEGVAQSKLMFASLKDFSEVEEIWTSPWTRARETASIASEKWKVPLREVDWLAGGAMSAQDRRWQLPRKRDIAIVGHEPDLGELVGELCGGTVVNMKKCGAALLDGDPATGMELQFLLTPKLVAALSGRD